MLTRPRETPAQPPFSRPVLTSTPAVVESALMLGTSVSTRNTYARPDFQQVKETLADHIRRVPRLRLHLLWLHHFCR